MRERSRIIWLTSTELGFPTDNHCLHWSGNHAERLDSAPAEAAEPRPLAIHKLTLFVIPILGTVISGGELCGRMIVLRIGGKFGEASGITIRVPPAWEYSSCLGAMSSDTIDLDPRPPVHLDDLLVGLVGAEITLFKINPTNVIIECGSIRIEKRFSNQEDSVRIEDHNQKICYRIGQESCVEEFL